MEGLLGFGPMNYGLLSPQTLASIQSPQQSQGTFGQSLPGDYVPYDPTAQNAKFDPYYNLRNIPGLLNNPNFSWLNSMNLQPFNMSPLPSSVLGALNQAELDRVIQAKLAASQASQQNPYYSGGGQLGSHTGGV